MSAIDKNIRRLLDAVKRSDVYKEYRIQEENLNRNPELKNRVDLFRGNNYQLQNESGQDDLFHTVNQIALESVELRSNPEVNAYLDAELALCRMMQKICTRLTEGIDMDTPDVDTGRKG